MAVVTHITDWICDLASLAASSWLAYSAVTKLLDVGIFRVALIEHRIVPPAWIQTATWGVPLLEAGFALGSIASVTIWQRRTTSLCICASAFVALSVYVAIAHFTGASGKAGCGCSGSQTRVDSWLPLLLQNASIGCALLFGVALQMRSALARKSS